MVSLVDYCIEKKEIAGPVNAVAPRPVTNDEFGRALGKQLGTAHWLPVPGLAMKLILGEMSEIVLAGQHVYPRKLTEHGFTFQFPMLEKALADLIRIGGKS